MSTPAIPGTGGPVMTQVAGGVDPQSYTEYLKAVAAQQSNTTGLTQVGPNLGTAQGPTQKVYQQGQGQQNKTFGPGEGAARKRESMQNLVSSAQNLASQIGQQHQAKQQREYQLVIGRYTQSIQGIQQAQAQVQQAQAALKQNPQDPQAQALLQQAQAAIQTNKANLTDLSNDKKQSTIIKKAFGIDDKNADSPERQAAIQALQKQMGVDQKTASTLSRLPQTQQLSPQAQAQSQARQAGVVGAPATQGQILAAQSKAATNAQTEAGKDARAQLQADIRREALGLNADGKPIPLDQLPLEKRAKIEVERTTDDLRNAQTQYTQARQMAMSDPNNPGYKLAVLRTEATMLGARARMMGAVTGRMNYDMRAMGTGPDGQPLPGTANVGGQTIGTAVAPNLEKVLTQTATFTDVRGAMKNLEASTLQMQQSGVNMSDPAMVKFLTDISSAKDKGTIDNLITGMVGRGLNSQQQDYARSYSQAIENISALRGILKGSTSEANIERMVKTLPGPGTPNYGYALGQINAIYGQLDRLQTGLPKLNLHNQPGSAPNKSATPTEKNPLGLNLPGLQ